MSRCLILGEQHIHALMLRYFGIGRGLNHDEKELLMFALELESEERGGVAAEVLKGGTGALELQRRRECERMMRL